jgi:hypothetical protein
MTARRTAAAGALTLAALIAYLAWPHGSEAARDEAVVAATAREPVPSTAHGAQPELREAAPDAPDGAPSLARIKREYEAYKQASVYPHWSFRLTPDMDFLLRWNAAITDDLPVSDDGALVARFDADRGRAFAGEPYTSWIEIDRVAGGERRAVPFAITRAVVVTTSGPSQGEAFELAYHDDGADGDARAGDHRYTNRFVPSARPELAKASTARIDLYAQIDGQARVFHRDLVFAPRAVIEVVGAHDAMDQGSLAITLDVVVHEPGVYTFYGNLMGPDGQTPIAVSKRTYPLEAGRHTAQLVFFGKVIRDVGADGPYVVRDIHGLLRGHDDQLDVWWDDPTPVTTAAYRATDFSPAEWDDPERRERLANFEHLIGAMERGDE